MTRPGVRCGNHSQATYHETVAEVRACYAQPTIPATPADWFDHEIQRREREESERVAWEKMNRFEPFEPCGISKPVTTEGVYRNPQTGDIFKVYRTVHGANQLVAKRLQLLDAPYFKTQRGKQVEIRAEFVYEGKAGLRGLTASMQMSLEEAKKYGALYGVCVRCSATLTREESIERAMGPVCARKVNWA